MKKFPKTVYVTRENAGTDDEYLGINGDDGDIPEVDSTTPVAIYELVETAEIVVTREVKSKARK